MGQNRDLVESAFSDDNKKLLSQDSNETLLIEGGVKSFRVTSMRWLALTFTALIMLGNYMSIDFPSYLQNQIGQQIFGCPKYSGTSDACQQYKKYYPWLYSLYSLPNCILPLFGGFFLDKIGIRTGVFIFTTILIIGQLVCAMSGIFSGGWSGHPTTVFTFFYIGRFIFALGGENINITEQTIVSKWFVGKELAFALGSTICVNRIGSVTAGLVLPSLFTAGGNSLTLPLFFTVIMCVISFGFMTGIVTMDKIADKQEGKNKDKQDSGEKINFKDIKEFPLIYWILTIYCQLNYVCMFVFLQFGNDFLQKQYQDGETQASNMLTLPYLITAVLSPIIGLVADKFGRRQWVLLFATSIMVAAHLMWLFFPTCPLDTGVPKCSMLWQVIPLVTMGIFYSFFASIIWPCIPLVLSENLVGTGFGVAASILNIGLFTAPLLVGYIISSTVEIQGGYFWSQIFFISIGVVCLLLSIWIIIENSRTGDKLGKIYVNKGDINNKNKTSQLKSSFHI